MRFLYSQFGVSFDPYFISISSLCMTIIGLGPEKSKFLVLEINKLITSTTSFNSVIHILFLLHYRLTNISPLNKINIAACLLKKYQLTAGGIFSELIIFGIILLIIPYFILKPHICSIMDAGVFALVINYKI